MKDIHQIVHVGTELREKKGNRRKRERKGAAKKVKNQHVRIILIK